MLFYLYTSFCRFCTVFAVCKAHANCFRVTAVSTLNTPCLNFKRSQELKLDKHLSWTSFKLYKGDEYFFILPWGIDNNCPPIPSGCANTIAQFSSQTVR